MLHTKVEGKKVGFFQLHLTNYVQEFINIFQLFFKYFTIYFYFIKSDISYEHREGRVNIEFNPFL